jgi:hypothetical protein
VGTEARKWRRAAGPTAWVVLEELVAIAAADANGRWSASTSIRGLAAELGLGRDSVDAALRRLRLTGLVAFAAPRRPADGRFGSGGYVVSDEIVAGLRGAPPSSVRIFELSARRAGVAMMHEQLGLTFDDVTIRRDDAEARPRSSPREPPDADAVDIEDVVGACQLAVSPAVEALSGGLGEGRHELASSMPAVAGDVRGDVTGVSVRDGEEC